MASAQEMVKEVRDEQKRRAVSQAVRELDSARYEVNRHKSRLAHAEANMKDAQEKFDKKIALIESGEEILDQDED
jgi:hypothetical protein